MMQRASNPTSVSAWFVRLQTLLVVFTLLGCNTATKEKRNATDGQRTTSEVPPSDTTKAIVDTVPTLDEREEADDGHVVGALETYRYWTGQDPDEDMRVLNGEYWASAHWSKEYTMYLELRFPRAKDFVMGNNLTRIKEQRQIAGAPDWFTPPAKYEVWEGQLGSLYFLHPKGGHIYIFERQF